jgi:hypothetical protein
MAERVAKRDLTNPALKAALAGSLAKLMDRPVLSPAFATRDMDQRLIPIVLAIVYDEGRQPLRGILLELTDDAGQVIDTTHTSDGGLGVLRFAARSPRPPRRNMEGPRVTPLAGGGDVTGTVHLIIPEMKEQKQNVVIHPDQQAARIEFVINRKELSSVEPQFPPGDNPLMRWPTDFSEQACDALILARTNGLLDQNPLVAGQTPLLSFPLGAEGGNNGYRIPLVRRLNIIRYGPDNERYLVQLRQEWVLLAYTLGELAQVQALDPGAVLQSANQLVNQVSSAAREAIDTTKSTLSQTLQDAVSNLGSIDSVVHTVQNTSASAGGIAGGFGIPGLFFIGGASVDASLNLDLRVDTNINTSLLTNRVVQQVSTLVNEAIAKAHAIAEGTQDTAMDVVNHLAPLVSQVANALHWRVYEVYAVCTNVDAVYHITPVSLFSDPLTPFTADQVLAFRPFFAPALLDPTLLSAYDQLLQAAELTPLTQVTLEVTYDATFTFSIGIVSATVSGTPTVTAVITPATATPAPGTGTTTGTSGIGQKVLIQINFPTPGLARGSSVTATVTISATPPTFVTMSATIRRVQVWIDQPLSGPDFIIDSPPATFTVPIAGGSGAANVLLNHVNANLHYYYGVLAAASINVPSLRQDVDFLTPLATLGLYRLPLMGMEGTTALLLDATQSTIDQTTLLDDPGAGTLVQILAPGAYGEMLAGLLQIPVNLLHPLLQQAGTFSPFGVFPNLTAANPATSATNVLGNVSSIPP